MSEQAQAGGFILALIPILWLLASFVTWGCWHTADGPLPRWAVWGIRLGIGVGGLVACLCILAMSTMIAAFFHELVMNFIIPYIFSKVFP